MKTISEIDKVAKIPALPSAKHEISEEVAMVYNNWLKAKNYHTRNYDRSIENWRYYSSLNPELGFGQWPKDVVDNMIQQERQLLQYNIIAPAVQMIAGALLQTPLEPDFIPVNSELTSLTRALKSCLYSDRELMDWKAAEYEMAIGGLVYESVVKFEISREFSKLGNIALKVCLPGSVFSDPLWKTNRSKDCKVCWKETWLTPSEMALIYPEMASRIKFEVLRQTMDGVSYGEYTGVIPFRVNQDTWGSAYRVIEEYRMIEKRYDAEYVMTAEGDVEIPEAPEETKQRGIDAVFTFKKDWLDRNYPTWAPDYVYTKPSIKKICIVKAVCPSLVTEKLLENRPSIVQIGCLPFKWWSSGRVNGEPKGLVDDLKDAQTNLNYHEAMIEYKIKCEGGGGAMLVDETKFADHGEFLKFAHHRNKQSSTIRMKPSALDSGRAYEPINKSQFPSELYRSIEHIISMIWPRISRITPTLMGQRDPGLSEMSGRLYNLMKIQSDLQTFNVHYTWRYLHNEIFEGYLIQAAQLYSNGSIPRTFTFNKGKDKITINERVILPDGSIGIKNDFSKLLEMRHKVIINEKIESPTEKAESIQILANLMTAIPQTKIATINKISNNIISKLEQIPDEEKEEFEAIAELELERDVATLEMQIAQAKLQKAQAESMLNQMQAPPVPPIQAIPGTPGAGGMVATPATSPAGPPAGLPPEVLVAERRPEERINIANIIRSGLAPRGGYNEKV